ncbi:MAG: hypothetical protein VX519_07055 [Myxococcota bacterium]|nr:hypothetical protein [Myxococcota bacterium]
MHKNTLFVLSLSFALTACGGDSADTPSPSPAAEAPAPAAQGAQDPLVGGPFPTLILSQAWFTKGSDGKPKPGPARLEIWRQGESGWDFTRLEDPDSNVFHKSILRDDGSILTIGASGAWFKKWQFANGKWSQETLWHESWGGKFDRLRDIEIGDVDGDGQEEYVIATHDYGVLAVYNPPAEGQEAEIIQLDKKADTFVHEIEIGDIEGDGQLEFFATPSDRNKANQSQHGEVVMYKFDGEQYVRSIVDPGEGTHAKEILVSDIDGDGKSEVFSVQEAVIDANKKVLKPVTIRQYTAKADGSFGYKEIAQIDDRQTRFLLAEDFDGNGTKELIAAAMKTGLYRINLENGAWTTTQFDANSASFEHAIVAADLEADGQRELYVAADDQQELKRYDWNAETGTFDKTLLGKLEGQVFTWNIEAGSL